MASKTIVSHTVLAGHAMRTSQAAKAAPANALLSSLRLSSTHAFSPVSVSAPKQTRQLAVKAAAGNGVAPGGLSIDLRGEWLLAAGAGLDTKFATSPAI
jgi:hypothetical protein